MKAMVLRQQAQIETGPLHLEVLPDPEPQGNEVRIKVEVCAICRTDLHVIEGDLPPLRMPIIPGHQIVGRIDKLGPESKLLTVGRRIGIAWLRETDGTCRFCQRQRENLCESAMFTGYMADGGYAEYAVVSEDFAYPIPDELSNEDAGPLLCAGIIGFRSLQRASVPDGGKLLLVGFGSSAHIVIQIALHRGYKAYVVTRGDSHVRLAGEMGALWAGERMEKMPVKVDSAIIFAPAGDLIPPTLDVLDRGGILCLAGIHMSEIPSMNYERDLFYEREIRTVTANTRKNGHELLQEACASKVKPRTKVYPLEEANHALQDLKNDRIDGTGILVVN